ncbi:hypothetical protein BT96DRAFT_305119 [Gymnopus androsaceus JB14]|uniref:Uncharacterized protein n=1 Tax=Gymnopus androsaceus JB14 TaxID=1447944 RepID=A0A6A4I9P0_9AGAR|nr:hypothetical protein BT96DRAFT_305119 [Gymnopus androsaceus JB14]
MFLSKTQLFLGPKKLPFWPRIPYLFIAPVKIMEIRSIPYFSFHNEPYFWSFDLNGIQKISPTTQMLLGLPSLEPMVHGLHWSASEHKAVLQYLQNKGFSSGLKYSRKQGYPLFKAPKSNVQVESEEFEIIDAESDVADNADVEDDWGFISDNLSCHSSDDSEISDDNQPRHSFDDSDCTRNHKPFNQPLRRTRSLSSFNPNGDIHEPIENRVLESIRQFWCQDCDNSITIHPAVQKPCMHREHHIHQAIQQAIQEHGYIPWEHMDFCLDLINY